MTDWLWQLLFKISGGIKSHNLFTLGGIENTRGGWKPEGATIRMCVLYPFRARRLGSGSSSRSGVLATFLPGMSLRVYVRVRAESISLTQTHTHTHTTTVNAPAMDDAFILPRSWGRNAICSDSHCCRAGGPPSPLWTRLHPTVLAKGCMKHTALFTQPSGVWVEWQKAWGKRQSKKKKGFILYMQR